MDPSRTYLSLKLNHMHAIHGTPLASSILGKTDMDLVRLGCPALEYPQHLTSAPWPPRIPGVLSAEKAVLNSSFHFWGPRQHLEGQKYLNSH